MHLQQPRMSATNREQHSAMQAMSAPVGPSVGGPSPQAASEGRVAIEIPPPEVLPRLPGRAPDSHKGDYGRVLLIGGSQGMAGALALAGLGALRSGAGLVQLAVPQSCQAVVARFEPSYMVAALPEKDGCLAYEARERLQELTGAATVVACGPGMGRTPAVTQLVAWLYARLDRPLVVDADGLNALAESAAFVRPPAGPRVLTPHPGEFRRLAAAARLKGIDLAAGGPSEAGAMPATQSADRRQNDAAAAALLAGRCGVVIVLKGHGTLVTDGRRSVVNTTGNPGMATGGTGDVLTGVLAALWAQGLGAFEAAQLGVFVHGLAGDLAAAELGQVSLIASDLVRYLPRAFSML